jgi:hypothetical protein
MKWKVFYIDGSSFSNMDGVPQDAPGWGVLAVAQEDETVGVLVHQGNNYYVFDEQYDGWYGLDDNGFAQYVARSGLKIVKLGESMSTERYKTMIKEIRENPNLPAKSARYEWERKF